MQYPVYEITFNENEDLGMTAISFVDYPAICNNFVYFGKGEHENTPALYLNKVKHEVVSPILIPNQLILRISETGEKYYIRWSKETIERVAKQYLINQYNNNFSVMHSWFETGGNYEDSLIDGVYMLEMWTIDDAKNDRANKVYGYHLPEGTLMVHLKIHNRKLWQKIVSGDVKGLSIEAFIPVVEAGKITYSKNKKQNKTLKMNKNKLQNLFNQFMLWYSEVSEEAKELADIATADETESGEVSLKYYTSDTDYIEIDADGTARGSDGEVVADGEYSLADGNLLVVEDGKFKETKTVEESTETEPVEAPIAEECDDEEKKDEEKQEVSDEEKDEEPVEETPSDEDEEEKQEEVDAPYTLVEIEINGETFNVPQEVADYIKSLEEAAVAGENFRKELARLQSATPSAKPVGNVVKQEIAKEDKTNVVDFAGLIANMNKKLK